MPAPRLAQYLFAIDPLQETTGIAVGYRVQSQPAFPPAAASADLPLYRRGQMFVARSKTKETRMFHFNKESRLGRGLLLAAVVAGAAALAVPAVAGECPADQKKANAREAVDLKPVGVTDTTIAAIDVSKAPFNIDGRNFRMRKLVVEPGGIVPWHSHADRPAIIYIVEGEIHEYASNCSVPLVHEAGDVVAETPDVSHWWKNLGDTTVVLLSADLLKDTTDHNM
jgi:quercetin dioxygenase-like cupin family protein